MADSNIVNETSLNFNDRTSMDIGFNDDRQKIVLIVRHPEPGFNSPVSAQIRVELNVAEANKLYEVIRSKVQLLQDN